MDERVELAGALEGAGRLIMPNNTRVLSGLITHPLDSSLDDLLVKAPSAVKALLSDNNPAQAKEVLGQINNRIGSLTKAKNYGYDIDGHHPISLMSSYLAASDMDINNAAKFYDQARKLGLPIGTVPDYMLPLSQIAHDYAHLDPITHKTNKKGFQSGAMQFRQADPIARANAWAPMANLEQTLSNLGYNLPQEQTVRRMAADKVGIDVENLTSFVTNPNYVTPTGRAGNVSYVTSARKILDQEIMNGILTAAYNNQKLNNIIAPNQYTKVFASAKREPELRDRTSKNAVYDLSVLRPGQENLMRRFL